MSNTRLARRKPIPEAPTAASRPAITPSARNSAASPRATTPRPASSVRNYGALAQALVEHCVYRGEEH